MEAKVAKMGIFQMQVCVPGDWTDIQILEFAEKENPANTANGWNIIRQGDGMLCGCDERVTCVNDQFNVHVALTV